MSKHKLVLNDKRIVSFLLVYLLSFVPLTYYINLFLQDQLKTELSISAISYGFAVCFGLYTYFVCFKRSGLFGIVIVTVLLLGTVFYWALYTSDIKLVFTDILDLAYNPSIILFAYSVPVLLITLSDMVDYEKVIKSITIIGRIVILILILYFFVFNIGWKIVGGQYMTTSYYALPSLCVLMLNHAKQKRVVTIDGIIALIGMFLILIGGARGTLVCAILFALLLVVFSPTHSKKKKWIVALVFIALGLFILIGLDNVLSFLESYVSIRGLESRTIAKFGNNSFFTSNDRVKLWSRCIDAIWKSPIATIFGYGLWGDRPIVKGYSHNIFIEFVTSFGFLFGSVFFLLILLRIIKTIVWKSKRVDEKYFLFLIAIPYGFFQLFFSDSFLLNPWFFLMVGLIYGKKNSDVVVGI